MRNLKTKLLFFTFGVVLVIELIYQFLDLQQLDAMTFFSNSRLECFTILFLAELAAAYFRNEVAASNALTTEFPVETNPKSIGNIFANGILALDTADAKVPITVTTTLTERGILITEEANRWRTTTDFLLPWERIKRCSIRKSKNYEDGLSKLEMQSRFKELRAILRVSRGSFPPFEIEIPGTYSVNRQIPANSKLRVEWY